MDKKLNYEKGRNGENIAKEYLMEKSFNFIESNYENKIGEIDLIMSQGTTLVFVEVKLKIGDKYGMPEEMINSGKIRQVQRVAESYLTINPDKRYLYKQFRVDAVCIVMNEMMRIERINHYENLY